MKHLILLSVLALGLSSCSKNLIPYTKQLQIENDWNRADVQRIQFYTSEDIILQRKLVDGKIKIESGKIKVVDGKKVEEVVIKKGTPGIAVYFPDEDRVGISFEIDDAHFLTFGPNPKKGEQFFLFASEWNNRVGRVTYNDVAYYTSPESSTAHLLVNLKEIRDWDIKQRKASGRKVN
ncbi:MAG: hypothetical protein HKN92_09960 [Chitinophagales bacterium]|nr:hypothetical protein [Chitinophagales bacterium]